MVARKTATVPEQPEHIVTRARRVLRSLDSHKRGIEALVERYEHGERGHRFENQLADEIEQMEEAFQMTGGK